jgi:hypothetical protein
MPDASARPPKSRPGLEVLVLGGDQPQRETERAIVHVRGADGDGLALRLVLVVVGELLQIVFDEAEAELGPTLRHRLQQIAILRRRIEEAFERDQARRRRLARGLQVALHREGVAARLQNRRRQVGAELVHVAADQQEHS